MNPLVTEVVKRPCAFVMHISDPVETLRKLALLFKDREIIVDSLNMHRYRSGEANLVVHCQVEKDRITRTVQLLGELPGIIKLERMEGK